MTIAQQVKKKIDKHYEQGYINYADLANHLKNGRIDTISPSIKHTGFDKPYNDNYPVLIYYEDNSFLVVTGHDVFAAKKT